MYCFYPGCFRLKRCQRVIQLQYSLAVLLLVGHPVVPFEFIFHVTDAFTFHGVGDNQTGLAGSKGQRIQGLLQLGQVMAIYMAYRPAEALKFLIDGVGITPVICSLLWSMMAQRLSSL